MKRLFGYDPETDSLQEGFESWDNFLTFIIEHDLYDLYDNYVCNEDDDREVPSITLSREDLFDLFECDEKTLLNSYSDNECYYAMKYFRKLRSIIEN